MPTKKELEAFYKKYQAFCKDAKKPAKKKKITKKKKASGSVYGEYSNAELGAMCKKIKGVTSCPRTRAGKIAVLNLHGKKKKSTAKKAPAKKKKSKRSKKSDEDGVLWSNLRKQWIKFKIAYANDEKRKFEQAKKAINEIRKELGQKIITKWKLKL